MDGSRYSACVARSDDDPEEVNSSNNTNNKNWKLPTTEKMIQQSTDVEIILRTVREEVRQLGELSSCRAKAELCEGIRLKLNAEAGLDNFGVTPLSEAGLGEWPLPFLVVKESFVSQLNKKTIKAISLKYSGF